MPEFLDESVALAIKMKPQDPLAQTKLKKLDLQMKRMTEQRRQRYPSRGSGRSA